jgi:chemotaxis protein methyltransferase CheR
MCDSQCVAFLQWALPRLGLRWDGYQKVRRQMCKRAQRRAGDLGLSDLSAYRTYLETHSAEWAVLDTFTPITISRFYRDRGTFEFLTGDVLPALAAQVAERGSGRLEIWSAGCASGEEPYTLTIIWELELAHRFPDQAIHILATDVHPAMLARARRACFSAGSLRDLPERWRAAAFVHHDGQYRLRARFRQAVTVASHDIRTGPPDGPFDVVLCRNLVFTYFDMGMQHEVGVRVAQALRLGGALVLGAHEDLPATLRGFEAWDAGRRIYRRTVVR